MFRRKTIPADLQPSFLAFTAQADRVERARQALLGCLPVGRVDPAPVPVGLDLLADELHAVEDELDAWQAPAVDAHWQACRTAVAEALAGIAHAHRVAAETGELEELLDAVGAVVEPLDAWRVAERHWRSLRR